MAKSKILQRGGNREVNKKTKKVNKKFEKKMVEDHTKKKNRLNFLY